MPRRQIQFQLSRDSHEAFKQAVKFVWKHTDKSSKEILTKAGMAYAVAGRKLTPKARKNKKRQVSIVKRRRNAPSEYQALVLAQHQKPKLVTFYAKGGIAAAKKEPIAAVPNVGAAKGSWNGMMRSLGSSERSGLKRTGRLSNSRFLTKQAVELTNRLSYLFKVTKGLTKIARMNAAKQMIISTESALDRTTKAFK